MSEWKARRFWKSTAIREGDAGFLIELDGRQVKTPSKSLLAVPGRAMAEAIAAEWDAQSDVVNPLSMPFTRSANSAIDKVRPQHGDVADMLAGYGDSDLLCYRADSPRELVEHQAEQWDPALDWAEAQYGVRLETRTGIMHRRQNPETLARLSAEVHKLDAFQLTGFHDLVSLSGSLVLGLASVANWRDIDAIWTLSRVDEDWQVSHWGHDDEAADAAGRKRAEFLHAKRFFDLARGAGGSGLTQR